MTNAHDIRNRQPIHDRLQADVDAFVERGGKVETLAPCGRGERSLPVYDTDDDLPIEYQE